MAPAVRPELLKISSVGCLKEDERYQLRLVTDSADDIVDISIVVDGEEVARGLTEGRASYQGDDGRTLYVYAPTLIGGTGTDGQILLLIYGFARIEVALTLVGGGRVSLESEDIPVLVRGDRESETARVEGMFDALFSAPPSRPLQWMLTGTPSFDERFSIVEGGTTSPASRSLSTFLQVTAQVLSEFERLLPSFRAHVRSSISEVPTRVPGNKVRVVGAREARWIGSHPHLLQRSHVESGVRLGSGSYMPRYVQTERRARSYDTYENRTIISFLAACGQRLGRISSLMESERGLSESVEKALNPFSVDGYILSSLLITSSSHRRGEATRDRAEALRRKAAALEHAYGLAAPGTEAGRFLPPRRSKVFQEVVPYTRLYELMMRWCTMGDLDLRGSLLALRTARMDRFYEYFVLLSLLSKLDERGFVPSRSSESPIGVVEYSLARTSRYYQNEGQVANKYVLDGEVGTVTLYYQPVIYGDTREENGIRLHRTSVGASGHDSYYTPDFLLVFNSEIGAKTVAIDAKYRYTQGVMRGIPESELQKCVRKYRQEVSGITGSPDAVWLLCGRDTDVETCYWEQSSWAQSAKGFVRSGAVTLTPMGDDLDNLFEMIGITRPHDLNDEQPPLLVDQPEDFQPSSSAEAILPKGVEDYDNGWAPRETDYLHSPSEDEPLVQAPGITVDTETNDSDATESEEPDIPAAAELEPNPAMAEGVAAAPPIQEKNQSEAIDAHVAERRKTESEPKTSHKIRSVVGNKRQTNGGLLASIGELVTQIHELLGQNSRLLFDDGWSRANIGLGRPALRDSMPSGKEASRYIPFVIGKEEVFLAKDWTPVNINRAKLLVRRLSK